MKPFLRFAFVVVLLTGCAITQPVDKDKFLEFHRRMIHKPLSKKGCFKAKYPIEQWIEDVCAPPRLLSAVGLIGLRAETAGNPMAEVTSGLISRSMGSFEGVVPAGSGGDTTSYSLQLNSQPFDTPACAGAVDPSRCRGWQQFIYDPTSSGFIQYWLLDYGDSCPVNWNSWKHKDCYRTSRNSIPPGHEKLSELTDMSFGGAAEAGGMDTITLGTRSRGWVERMNDDGILDLGDGWRATEFGVFGESGGSQVKFGAGTTLVVKTLVDNETKNAPKCRMDLLTGETNNLQFVGPCCTYGGETPAIVFTLSNDPGATSVCPTTSK